MSPHEFARLVDAHGAPLILYARQWCAAPEDVVQEAFLKLVRQGRPPDDPVAWLYRVVRNGALDAGKLARRRPSRERSAARPDPWFVEPGGEGPAAVETPPVGGGGVIAARLWGGLGFEQVATLAGCSASTAFRRYSAGIDALRKELGVPCPTR